MAAVEVRAGAGAKVVSADGKNRAAAGISFGRPIRLSGTAAASSLRFLKQTATARRRAAIRSAGVPHTTQHQGLDGTCRSVVSVSVPPGSAWSHETLGLTVRVVRAVGSHSANCNTAVI